MSSAATQSFGQKIGRRPHSSCGVAASVSFATPDRWILDASATKNSPNEKLERNLVLSTAKSGDLPSSVLCQSDGSENDSIASRVTPDVRLTRLSSKSEDFNQDDETASCDVVPLKEVIGKDEAPSPRLHGDRNTDMRDTKDEIASVAEAVANTTVSTESPSNGSICNDKRGLVSRRGGRSGTPSPLRADLKVSSAASTLGGRTLDYETYDSVEVGNREKKDDAVQMRALPRALSLQPRKISANAMVNENDTVPSLCSTTSGNFQSTVSPSSVDCSPDQNSTPGGVKGLERPSRPTIAHTEKLELTQVKKACDGKPSEMCDEGDKNLSHPGRKPFSITCDTSTRGAATSPLHGQDVDTVSDGDAKRPPVSHGATRRVEPSTSERIVTFSPVPTPRHVYNDDVKKGMFTPTKSPGGQFGDLSHFNDASLTSPGLFLSPYMPSPSTYGVFDRHDTSTSKAATTEGVKKEGVSTFCSKEEGKEEEFKKASESERDCGGGVTPTNFASDFGKRQTSSFDESNVLSWLQSPTANSLFSPGGLISSMNTPRGMFGTLPRTPRTPNLSSSFFFSDIAGLPQSSDFTSPKTVEGDAGGSTKHPAKNNAAHPYSSMICISPLASSKRNGGPGQGLKQRGGTFGNSVTNTPINFKDVFASPNPSSRVSGKVQNNELPVLANLPSGGDLKTKGQSSSRHSGGKFNLDVHMAERDLMEDEDLSVLLQLAQSTPRATANGANGGDSLNGAKSQQSDNQEFRSFQTQNQHRGFAQNKKGAYESDITPPSLQLPLIGKSRQNLSSPSKLSRKTAFRENGPIHLDDFTPPPIAIRSNSSSGSREIVSGAGNSFGDNAQYRGSSTGGLTAKSPLRSFGNGSQGLYESPLVRESHSSSTSATPNHKTKQEEGRSPTSANNKMSPVVSYQPNSNSHGGDSVSGPALHSHGSGQRPPAPQPENPGSQSHPHPGGPPLSTYSANHLPSFSQKSQGGPGSYVGGPMPPHMHGPPHGAYPHHHHHPPLHQMQPHSHYHFPYPGGPPASHHPYPIYQNQSVPNGTKPTSKLLPLKKGPKDKSLKDAGAKRPLPAPTVANKKQKKNVLPKSKVSASSTKKSTSPKPSAATAATEALNNPVDRQKAAAAITAMNAAAGNKNDRAAALAAAILRGVTMRPSGKWQAQLYYAGKSRYIGVFDTREKAALAYEIAREKLKADNRTPSDQNLQTLEATEDAVNCARKAAFEGVNEKDPRLT